MKVFSIYKATNKINNKSYIGFDANWPSRQKQHLKDSKNLKKQYAFHRAIRKYGWDSFEWEIICQSLDGKYLLNVMEGHFIDQYDTFNGGYNMTRGGEGGIGKIISEKHKLAISKKLKGQKAWNKGIPNPKGKANAQKGANKMRQLATGRKRYYYDDGSWTWKYPEKKCEVSVAKHSTSSE